MRKLSELDIEIKKAINFEIIFNAVVENYLYNGYWVNEFPNTHYEKLISKLNKRIDKAIDFDNPNHINYLKSTVLELNEVSKSLQKFDNNKLSTLEATNNDWDIELDFPRKPPENNPREIDTPRPGLDYGSNQDIIEDTIAYLISIDTKPYTHDKYDSFEDFLIKAHSIEEQDLDLIYAKAHLAIIIFNHRTFIEDLKCKFLGMVNLVNKLKKFSDTSIEENTSANVSISDLSIQFAMKKQDIATFFHALHELGIVKTDTDDIFNSQTKLKNYIDAANIFYSDKGELVRVANIKKQFTALNNKEVNKQELKFLTSLVSKLNQRIEEIQNRES